MEEPNLDDFVAVLNKMRDVLRAREDPNCFLDQSPSLEDPQHLGDGREAGGNLLSSWLLSPNLHTVDSIDQLPLPKNWTWESNTKVWESVRMEVAGGVNSSSVMDTSIYGQVGENDGTFLSGFVEAQAVKLGTGLSVLKAELEGMVYGGAGKLWAGGNGVRGSG